MLKDELNTYIDNRIREFKQTQKSHLTYFLWFIPCGDDWKSKVSAATKLKMELNGVPVTYSEKDLAALTDARLGNIIKKYDDQLPPIFVAQRQVRRQRIQAEDEAITTAMIAASCNHGP